MFIVHSLGSDEKSPLKIFTSKRDDAKYAEETANKFFGHAFVYEWNGDPQDGLAAAKRGQLTPVLHYAPRDEPPPTPPDRPLRPNRESEELLRELINKMPKIARKF